MRRAGGKGLVVSAGENFREVAKRAIEREQCVGAEIRIRGKCAVIAILTHRRPAGEVEDQQRVGNDAGFSSRGESRTCRYLPSIQ